MEEGSKTSRRSWSDIVDDDDDVADTPCSSVSIWKGSSAKRPWSEGTTTPYCLSSSSEIGEFTPSTRASYSHLECARENDIEPENAIESESDMRAEIERLRKLVTDERHAAEERLKFETRTRD